MSQLLFNPIFTFSFDGTAFLICTAASLILGGLLAAVHSRLSRTTVSMLMTIVLLPFVVQTVLMLVNGNVGTGIAIAGAFGLIRFRSIQCKPEEIIIIFVATAIGLATSAGYLGIAAILTFIVIAMMAGFQLLTGNSAIRQHRQLKLTVPEGVSYDEVFNEVLDRFTVYHDLQSVRTTNMGSLYKLTYDVIIKDNHNIQNFLNELRVLNGNLEISLGTFPETGE